MSGIMTTVDDNMRIKPTSTAIRWRILPVFHYFHHHLLSVLQGLIEVGEANFLMSLPPLPPSDLLFFLEHSSIVLN